VKTTGAAQTIKNRVEKKRKNWGGKKETNTVHGESTDLPKIDKGGEGTLYQGEKKRNGGSGR